MFSDDDRPEWDPLYARGAKGLIDIPLAESHAGAIYPFFLGALLAEIHTHGYGYSDLHSRNVGILPCGGLILVDPGGTSQRDTTACACAGDFVVPCLDLSPENLAAFWQGYQLEAYKFIDPLVPNFCDDLREILFGLGPHDPSTLRATSENVASLFLGQAPQELPGTEPEAIDAALLLLAIASLNWEFREAPPDMREHLRLLDRTAALNYSGEISLAMAVEALGSTQLKQSANALVLGRTLSMPSKPEMRTPLGRPTSALLSPFLEPVIDQEPTCDYVRKCFVVALLALVSISKVQSNDAGMALTYGAIAFSIAGSPQAKLEELEIYNLACWRMWATIGGYTNVGPKRVCCPDPNVGFELALLHHKAACADRTLFVRSLERARVQEHYEPAWHAGLSSVDANRKCLLLIFYTLLLLPSELDVPSLLKATLTFALQNRMYTESQIAMLAAQTKRTGVETVMGALPDLVIKGADWAKEFLERLTDEEMTVQSCLETMRAGVEFFSYVNLDVELPGKTFKHSRQDIYFGFAQALDEDRIKRSTHVMGKEGDE